MSILHAIVLGIIEGVTEFLPISSTFHLLMATRLLGLPQTEFSKFFDVFIQAGAILAVVALFAREWFSERENLAKVAVSFIPTAIIGFVMHELITTVFFDSFKTMAVLFAIVGVIFLFAERFLKKKPEYLHKTISDMSWKEAVLVGVVQALAVFPGVSRAGAVMLGMMALGYKREEAAKYSFTLAVPTILAAAALDAIKMRAMLATMAGAEWLTLLVGTVVAFVSALVVIQWFIGFLRQRTFEVFGWYRILAGAVLFWLVR